MPVNGPVEATHHLSCSGLVPRRSGSKPYVPGRLASARCLGTSAPGYLQSRERQRSGAESAAAVPPLAGRDQVTTIIVANLTAVGAQTAPSCTLLQRPWLCCRSGLQRCPLLRPLIRRAIGAIVCQWNKSRAFAHHLSPSGPASNRISARERRASSGDPAPWCTARTRDQQLMQMQQPPPHRRRRPTHGSAGCARRGQREPGWSSAVWRRRSSP